MPTIFFNNQNRTVEAQKHSSVLEAAMEHGIPLYHSCGGNASCGTCRILVLRGAENLSPIEEAEAQVLDSFDLKPPYRLGCQSFLRGGEVAVEIPEWEKAPRPNKTPKVPE